MRDGRQPPSWWALGGKYSHCGKSTKPLLSQRTSLKQLGEGQQTRGSQGWEQKNNKRFTPQGGGRKISWASIIRAPLVLRGEAGPLKRA